TGAAPEPARPSPASPAPRAAEPPPKLNESTTTPVRTTPPRPRGAPRPPREKPLASPAVRLRAREAGVDLRFVHGSGPAGRITHDDLDAFIARPPQAPSKETGRAP